MFNMLYSNRSSKTAATKNILISIQEFFLLFQGLKQTVLQSIISPDIWKKKKFISTYSLKKNNKLYQCVLKNV